jgi:predicted transcriptional regulator
MAQKTKTREINIVEEMGTFTSIFKKFSGETKDYNFEGISALRKLLSNERARLLYTIKNEKPISVYSLAKKLGRNFKSVSEDIKLLERFGFIELISEKTGNRERLKPVLVVDSIYINIKI